MILLNFSHPLSEAQRQQLAAQTSEPITRVIDAPAQFEPQQAFGPQLDALLARVELTPLQWQHEPLLVVPPSLNFIAVLLLAEIHGRMGYFPPCVRLRPVANALPPRYEVAEILNLQAVRDEARKKR